MDKSRDRRRRPPHNRVFPHTAKRIPAGHVPAGMRKENLLFARRGLFGFDLGGLGLAPVQGRLVEYRLAHAQKGGQCEDTDHSGDDGTASQHDADGSDQVNGGDKGHAQRGAEQHQCAGDDGCIR